MSTAKRLVGGDEVVLNGVEWTIQGRNGNGYDIISVGGLTDWISDEKLEKTTSPSGLRFQLDQPWEDVLLDDSPTTVETVLSELELLATTFDDETRDAIQDFVNKKRQPKSSEPSA